MFSQIMDRKIVSLKSLLLMVIFSKVYHSTPCGEPGLPFNGKAIISSNQTSRGQYIPGTVVEYFCESDSQLLGDSKRRCYHKGFWDNKVPQCLTSLPIDRFLNYTLLDQKLYHRSNTLKVIDRNPKTCLSLQTPDNQTHHSFELTLTEEQPIKAILFLFSGISAQNKELLEYTLWIGSRNESKEYEIPRSYGQTRNSYIHRCNGVISADSLRLNYIKTANNDLLLCEIDVFTVDRTGMKCGTPDVPTNGVAVSQFTKNQLVFEFRCNPNYSLNGNKQIKCESNGLWSGLSPNCLNIDTKNKTKKSSKNVPKVKPKTCNDLVVENGRFAFTDGLKIGSQAVLECNTGYEVMSKSVTECLSTGVWNHSNSRDINCTEIHCNSVDQSIVPGVRRAVFKRPEDRFRYSSELVIHCNTSLTYERICGINGFWVKKSEITDENAISDINTLCLRSEHDLLAEESKSTITSMNILIIISSSVAVTTTLLVLLIFTLMKYLNRKLTIASGQALASVPVNDFSLIQIKHIGNKRRRYSEAKNNAYCGCDDTEVETRFSSTVSFNSGLRTAIIHTYSDPTDAQNIPEQNIYSEPYSTADNDIYSCDEKCFD